MSQPVGNGEFQSPRAELHRTPGRTAVEIDRCAFAQSAISVGLSWFGQVKELGNRFGVREMAILAEKYTQITRGFDPRKPANWQTVLAFWLYCKECRWPDAAGG